MNLIYSATVLFLLTLTAAAQTAVYQAPVTEDSGTAVKHNFREDRTGARERPEITSGNYHLQTLGTLNGTTPSYTIILSLKVSDFKAISLFWRELNSVNEGNRNACTRTHSYRAGSTGAFIQIYDADVTGTKWINRAVSLNKIAAVNAQEHIKRDSESKVSLS